MSKITLTNLVNLQNETTAVNAINANNAILTTALTNTLSRDGTSPNQMGATLDMNSNRIINLPTAVSTTEPVTLAQMTAALVANGNINTGLTGVPVSAAMQPVVAGTIANAQSQLSITPISSAMQPVVTSSTLVAAGIPLTPQMFGTVGNNVADDTIALQNWINAIQNTGNYGLFTPGFYKTTSPLSITAACTIIGSSVGLAATLLPGPSISAININTSSTVHLENFTITYNTTAQSGTVAISKTSPVSTQSIYDRFKDIVIFNSFVGISIDRATSWIADGLVINTTVNDGMVIQNTFNADNGDGCIDNCLFVAIGSNAIEYFSGGGLKITNLKVSTAVQGVFLNLSPSITTGDLLITNSSIEGVSGAAVLVGRQGSTGNWYHVLVNNCEFQSKYGVLVETDAFTQGWLQNLSCSNNTWLSDGSSSGSMYAIDSVNSFSVIGGAATYGGGTSTRKFVIGSGASNGVIGAIAGAGFTSSINNGTNVTTIAPF